MPSDLASSAKGTVSRGSTLGVDDVRMKAMLGTSALSPNPAVNIWVRINLRAEEEDNRNIFGSD